MFIIKIITFISVFWLLLSGCIYCPNSESYRKMYQHLHDLSTYEDMQETDYFLVILVNARHLDYSDNQSFCKTVSKHPSDGSKSGDVGHAWIYLRGLHNGYIYEVEGGHSGELGLSEAKYFDGIMNYIEYGYANPNYDEMQNPKFEPNPVKYLWKPQRDGFFQAGNGNHNPTFAAKIDITPQQFTQIVHFIHTYDYPCYSLTSNQCSSFVSQVAALANWPLESELSMKISQKFSFGGCTLTLWKDPRYSSITFGSPDVLERSLIQAVNSGKAEYALSWYNKYVIR